MSGDDTDLFILIGVLVTAVFTVVAAVLATRQRAQADLVDDLAARVDRLEEQNRTQANYIVALRGHIFDQKPPPPPDWPTALAR